MRTQWNDAEDDALHGLPWIAQLVYLRALRPYMDYSSGVVGVKRGVSLKSIAEMLHVEHGQGRRDAGDPSQKAVRHALELLERIGLIEKIPADRQLIFRLKFADTDSSASDKWGRRGADVGQTKSGISETSNGAASKEKRGRRGADPDPEKWGTPPVSDIPEEETTPLPPSFALAESIDRQAWAEFEQHRKEIRKPLTDLARTKAANILAPLSAEQQRETVNNSVVSRWPGLYPPKVNGHGQHHAHQSTRDKREAVTKQIWDNASRHDFTEVD